ncbi:hypothetical protein KUTeg_011151 [Tegillarca granosa]|uniref:glycerophosphocholine cholinephosphodiesterase n=1 Tax=Tegillarca granosa TaxID=220873 RepID=A0ABQ9F1N4_TEGGR|nr:hypothetical protein KUTeg_011151 [Tegillarca granosa]
MKNQHMRVFKKEEIPDKWFLKNHYRVPPIFLVADNGWFILTRKKICLPKTTEFPRNPGSGSLKGFHGYENTAEDMRAIFVAFGPDFKGNYKSKPFTNVNLYQLMCRLLGITPAPNNGIWSIVSDMLNDGQSSSSEPRYNGALLPNLILFLLVMFSL